MIKVSYIGSVENYNVSSVWYRMLAVLAGWDRPSDRGTDSAQTTNINLALS